jgi:hypothetical protein
MHAGQESRDELNPKPSIPGKESRDELNSKPGLLERLEAIRSQGASAYRWNPWEIVADHIARIWRCAVTVVHKTAE